MNFRSCFVWLVVLILSLSTNMIAANQKPAHRKCVAQCMEYCKNESESGIPFNLCDSVCSTMCYSARRDIGHADIH